MGDDFNRFKGNSEFRKNTEILQCRAPSFESVFIGSEKLLVSSPFDELEPVASLALNFNWLNHFEKRVFDVHVCELAPIFGFLANDVTPVQFEVIEDAPSLLSGYLDEKGIAENFGPQLRQTFFGPALEEDVLHFVEKNEGKGRLAGLHEYQY